MESIESAHRGRSRKYPSRRLSGLVLGLAMTIAAVPAQADPDDAEQARDLWASGEILSLEHLIARSRALHPGRVLDAKLHYEDYHGGYVYEIEILDRAGEIWELEYDARTGELIEREKGGDRR